MQRTEFVCWAKWKKSVTRCSMAATTTATVGTQTTRSTVDSTTLRTPTTADSPTHPPIHPSYASMPAVKGKPTLPPPGRDQNQNRGHRIIHDARPLQRVREINYDGVILTVYSSFPWNLATGIRWGGITLGGILQIVTGLTLKGYYVRT